MDYRTTSYYLGRAKGYIYTQNPNSPVATSDVTGGVGQSVVSAQTQATASPYVVYNLKTEHYLLPLVCEANCSYRLDYYNYWYSSPNAYYGAPSEFGSQQTIYGCNPYPYQTCYPNIAYGWIWMGNTNTSVLTPPTLSITNSRVSGDLKGTTQNVLLASPAGLQASVNPSNLNGNYVWSFTGPFVVDFSSQDNSYRSVFWTQPGTYIATVTYSGTGFSVTGNVTIQVRVPTLTRFEGNAGRNVVDRGSNCSQISNGASYTLECFQNGNNPTGMTWSATATIPNATYISDLSDAGLQFKQLVSVYRKRMNNGRLECFTARNPQTDPTTGWQLDGGDPYRNDVGDFRLGFQATSPPVPPEFDAPGVRLDGFLSNGTFVQYDAVSIDDRFEIYVYYFTGSPGAPTFKVPLHFADSSCPGDRFDCGVDRLEWRWGGQVNFDSSVPGTLYKEVSSNTTVGVVHTSRASSVTPYSGLAQSNVYSLCQGAVDTHNPIDGSRFFVRQLYLGFLNREPDAAGWDNWMSNITHCNVDTNCIYGNNLPQGWRFFTAKAFFYSPEVWTRYPALANPPGSPGFDPSAYNPAFVLACYNGLLGRDPDQGGFVYWVTQLDQYSNYDPVMSSFLTCPEFRQRFGAADPHY